MSLPLQNNNQPSRSPSKSSLRRTSGTGTGSRQTTSNTASPGPTTHFAAETTQHHFLPHSPPNQILDYDEDNDEQAVGSVDEASYQTALQPQTPFQPFFTLIEDASTNEHYHPTIHYIFADDEPDIITEAACRSIDRHNEASEIASTAEQEHDIEGHISEPRLPPLQSGVREHYLILDLHPSSGAGPSSQNQFSDRLPSPSPSSVETANALGKIYPYSVINAQSLSADWQILRTNITDAPTINAEQQHPDEQHLMLRIEGRGNSPDRSLQRRQGDTMEDMVERFQTRLAEVRHLMVELEDEHDPPQDPVIGHGADMFLEGGLVDAGFRPTGFGTAVLDEQD